MNPDGAPRRKRPSADELFELMSVLAHDLRTPLTPIKGYAEIIRTRPMLGSEKTANYATIVVEAAARLERSVDLLSGISALYRGRAAIRQETLRPVDVVAERLDVWRGRVPERSFTGQTAAAYGGVVADRVWLGKALDVLIDHAMRGQPAATTICLEAVTNDGADATCFTVSAVSDADDTVTAKSDRLGRAFVISVSDVCGYALIGESAIEVRAAPAP